MVFWFIIGFFYYIINTKSYAISLYTLWKLVKQIKNIIRVKFLVIPNCNLFLYYNNSGWVSVFIQQPQSQQYSPDLMTEVRPAEGHFHFDR